MFFLTLYCVHYPTQKAKYMDDIDTAQVDKHGADSQDNTA